MYKIEHYQETLDGEYTLEHTDIKFDTINSSVTAEATAYEHYTVNVERSTMNGTVVMPEIDADGTVQVLTLRVYYDLDPCTVTYDPDNGDDTDSVTAKYGASETLKAAPEKAGYTFDGWKLGDILYQPGDSITIQEDVTATAQWTIYVEPETPVEAEPEATPEPSTPTELTPEPEVSREPLPVVPSVSTPDPEPTQEPESPDEPVSDTTASSVSDQLITETHVAYIFGYPDGTVQPDGNITRAEIAMIFFRLLKDDVRAEYQTTENTFTDVSDSAWYGEAVSTLAAMGILNGNGEGSFAPDEPITRAELATVCARFDTSTTSGTSSFSDIEGHWAQAYIQRAASLGWVQGYEDGTFRPDAAITRAETMALINRVLDRTPESEDQFPEDMKTWPDNMDKTKWYYLDVQEATNTYEITRKITG
jgi:uncharacterized repeat protein (TIGR02543 family)